VNPAPGPGSFGRVRFAPVALRDRDGYIPGMRITPGLLAVILAFAPSPASAEFSADPGGAGADSAHAPRADSLSSVRIVRRFPPVEVRAPLYDLRSSQTVHVVTETAIRTSPVEDLTGLLSLQPGVVAQGEELHVRGGRAGETVVMLGGMSLNEPIRHSAMEVPLLALRSADLVSGAPEAQYGGGLAGTVDLQTMSPGPRPSLAWKWQTDGGLDTRYDRVGVRVGAPVARSGLALLAVGDALLDNTRFPALRSKSRHDVLGLAMGWRAENRLAAYLKVAPLARPERYGIQVLANRQVHQPYDPAWSLDGWTYVSQNPKDSPIFSPVPLPGYQRYRAADHLAITDEERLATLVSFATPPLARRATLSLGWLRARTVTSVGGGHEPPDASHRPRYVNAGDPDPFHVPWGDYPLYRESASDVLSLRVDGQVDTRSGDRLRAGAGVTYDEVSLREVDWLPLGWFPGGDPIVMPLDSVRTYHAFAPGGFGYVQGRWSSGGMILNTGIRAEYFTAGPQADQQTLPGDPGGTLSFSPHLGISYPVSVRDVFSFAYVRLHQAPARDLLYDRRTAIPNRQPLGNPGLAPSTAISYEAAVKHLLTSGWALQASLFYRDVFGQAGARNVLSPEGIPNPAYVDQDEAQAAGFEWSLVRAAGDGRAFEAHYTWMQAWGNESRPEGDPYGPLRDVRTPPVGDAPLSWDRRHTLQISGAWPWIAGISASWSTTVGSPLPWTPKTRRTTLTDLSAVNQRRLAWYENTDLDLRWSPPAARGLTFGLGVRNLFDRRNERAATLDGYPNPVINTVFDDYGAYRTETGLTGGAYLEQPLTGAAHWVPVHDPRLFDPPRTVRASVGASW
jgi:outer membrane receptor protein involved in Fe transport